MSNTTFPVGQSVLQNLSGRQDEIHFEVTSGACAWCAAQQGMFVLVRSLKNDIRLHYFASWKEYPSDLEALLKL